MKFVQKFCKVQTLRETVLAEEPLADTPELAFKYSKSFFTSEFFYPDVENFYVLILNTRRRITGHFCVCVGTLDTCIAHPREVFRGAVAANAAAIILWHNHPSGEVTPSEADIKTTRELIRAGQILKIEVLDHLICSSEKYNSLRELGYFYS